MKKLIKTSIVAVVMLIAVTTGARAGDLDLSLEVKAYKGKTVSFVVNNVQSSVALSLLDENNRVLYAENTGIQGTYKRTYNLEKLPEGTYYLEVESATQVKKYPIVVGTRMATLYSGEEMEMFKPTVFMRNHIVYVNLLSLDKSPLQVEVYDANNTLMYRETLKGAYELGKMYDFSKVHQGTYTFVLTHKDRTFVKKIKTLRS